MSRAMPDNGGPAFPRAPGGAEGMYLRDHFAGLAMQMCMLSADRNPKSAVRRMVREGTLSPEDHVAKGAYAMADAMLRARATGGTPHG